MISIDGTDISGVTIDGTDVKEITIDGNVAWRRAVTDGLVLRYQFENNGDTTVYDTSPVGTNDGSISGASYNTNEYEGTYSLHFDGSNDYVTFPNLGIWGGSGSFSMATWFYPTGGGRSNLCHPRDEADLRFEFNPSGNEKLNLKNYDGSNLSSTSSTGSLVYNAWQHCVITYNSGNVTFYIDGSQSGTGSTQTDYTDNPTDQPNFIGYVDSRSEFPLDGLLDDFRIYNRELSSSEVSTIYSG